MLCQIAITSIILAGASSSAIAGGLAEPVETMAPLPIATPVIMSKDWSGFYVGGGLGTGAVGIGDDPDIDSSSFGLNAGYRYDMGSIVLGGEVEYSALDFESAGDDFDASVLRLKGRVGYDAGAIMPYAVAGLAQLTIEDGSDTSDNGYFYGVGVDYAVTDNIYVGGEILQHQFDDFNDGGADIEAQTMSLRVGYSF